MPTRALIGDPRPPQHPTQVVRRAPHPVLLGDPIGDLLRRPGLFALAQVLGDRSQDRGRQGRMLPQVRLVWQEAEPTSEKPLYPITNLPLIDLQVARDARDAPTRIAETDHFQAVSGARRGFVVTGAPFQLQALLLGQTDAIQPKVLLPTDSSDSLRPPA